MVVLYLQSHRRPCYPAFNGVEMVMALHCIPDVTVDSEVVVQPSTMPQWLRVVLPVLKYIQVAA